MCLAYWWSSAKEAAELPQQGNPSELKAALIFAGLYALVLLAAEWSKENFGTQGLYVVAILSGLTDMDAITLSVSDMVARDHLNASNGWRLVLTAAIANLVFKAGIVASLGSKRLFGRVGLLFAVIMALSLAVMGLWDIRPGSN